MLNLSSIVAMFLISTVVMQNFTHSANNSKKPTSKRTNFPSSSSSDKPSRYPSVKASGYPSATPSYKPTLSPTVKRVRSPSAPPSTANKQSLSPTVTNSQFPTSTPTAAVPSLSPSQPPVVPITQSSSPTETPTAGPSSSSSLPPAVVITSTIPSSSPTVASTILPSSSPTVSPTTILSLPPTGSPSNVATSSNPSQIPTSMPTSTQSTSSLTTFFQSSQTYSIVTSNPNLYSLSSGDYIFQFTQDPSRPIYTFAWITGFYAQSSATSAQVTIRRKDGKVFDVITFGVTLMCSSLALGADIEVMPSLNGNDVFNDPILFPATGYSLYKFVYGSTTLPTSLTGADQYVFTYFCDINYTSFTFK